MKKQLLFIATLFCFSFYVFAQSGCSSCSGEKFNQDKKTDVLSRFPKAEDIVWKKCSKTKIQFAVFTLNDTTYSVVYNEKQEWLATEKRIFTYVKDYDWDKGKTLKTKIKYPSPLVFPKKYLSIMTSEDFDLDVSNYIKVKKLVKYYDKALIDFYTITLNDNHPLVKRYKTNTFYVCNLDGVEITFTNKKNVFSEFYDFYDPSYEE
ncbi:MAG: hypothetical protein GY827_07615 [Cytophagales bacterium]|nr:hypothetical protein [Cytophagales bacterium]